MLLGPKCGWTCRNKTPGFNFWSKIKSWICRTGKSRLHLLHEFNVATILHVSLIQIPFVESKRLKRIKPSKDQSLHQEEIPSKQIKENREKLFREFKATNRNSNNKKEEKSVRWQRRSLIAENVCVSLSGPAARLHSHSFLLLV